MFSGIIRTLGTVEEIQKSEEGISLTISSKLFQDPEVRIGDSICTNGVCLTIAELTGHGAKFFIVNESLRRSNLSVLDIGSSVHLEPSLRVGDKIDGHFVYGHVDARAEIMQITKDGEAYRFSLSVSPETLLFLAPKGSVALNGVSLTIGELEKDSFSVYIVPHTYKETLFSKYQQSDKLNLEIDPLARYVVNYFSHKDKE